MLGKQIETWSTPDYDATKYVYATAYMHDNKCNYHFRADVHGLEFARETGAQWANEIGGTYREVKHGNSIKVVVTDYGVTGRRQGRRKG